MFFVKPTNFNVDLIGIYIHQKQYKSLETYINNYVQYQKPDINIENITIYKPFFDFLNEFIKELETYFEEDTYYNSEINHYISKKYLDEIKSFGYFNLKFGESGYTGMYIIKPES
jgi:regulator of PEP synthase PpsR (kinase-PPPase family)